MLSKGTKLAILLLMFPSMGWGQGPRACPWAVQHELWYYADRPADLLLHFYERQHKAPDQLQRSREGMLYVELVRADVVLRCDTLWWQIPDSVAYGEGYFTHWMRAVAPGDYLLRARWVPFNDLNAVRLYWDSLHVRDFRAVDLLYEIVLPAPLASAQSNRSPCSSGEWQFDIRSVRPQALHAPMVLKFSIHLRTDGEKYLPVAATAWKVDSTVYQHRSLCMQLAQSREDTSAYMLMLELYDKDMQKRSSLQRVVYTVGDGLVSGACGSDAVHLDWVDTMTPRQLRYALRALAVGLSGHERARIAKVLKKASVDTMRHLLSALWLRIAPFHTRRHYERYMQRARWADEAFYSGFGYGFETDRGRIYMRYGPPDDRIVEEQEPDAYPYEIWIYQTTADGQRNVRFLFYNPSLASGQYELLHSTAVGERKNSRWERVLYSRATADPQPQNFIDEKRAPDGILRRARWYFTRY